MLSHSMASRPSGVMMERVLGAAIFILFAMIRSLPFVAVATGTARILPSCGNTQDTLGLMGTITPSLS